MFLLSIFESRDEYKMRTKWTRDSDEEDEEGESESDKDEEVED
jgi:hypothetical protein